MASKSSRDTLHKTSKDADGNPIFLILLDGVRASYERRMAACEEAWPATGDPLVVSEALTWVFLHKQPVPAWLHDAVVKLADKSKRAKRAKSHAEAPPLRSGSALDALSGGPRCQG